ncbi:MAG: hypothetical protein RL308_2893 [Bacteroidota bacterium]|jgi:hypothetical protein
MNLFKEIIAFIVIAINLWIACSGIIQAFKCPKMTQTELFLNIPNSFICNWKNCK